MKISVLLPFCLASVLLVMPRGENTTTNSPRTEPSRTSTNSNPSSNRTVIPGKIEPGKRPAPPSVRPIVQPSVLPLTPSASLDSILTPTMVHADTNRAFSISFDATNAVNVQGISLDLIFNPAQFSFEGIAVGSFLSENNKVLVLPIAKEANQGHIVTTIMRFGAGKGASGSGNIGSFRFRAKEGATNGAVQISRYSVSFLDGIPPDPDFQNRYMDAIRVVVSP